MSLKRSRKGEIPSNFITKWQSPKARENTPLVRRPMTACQLCRSAKVKCDGQQECARCTTRGLICIYTITELAVPTAQSNPITLTHTVPEERSSNINTVDTTADFPMSGSQHGAGAQAVSGLATDQTNEGLGLDDYIWDTMDPSMSQTFEPPVVISNSLDLDHFQRLSDLGHERLTTASPFLQANMDGPIVMPRDLAGNLIQGDHLFSSPICRCRDGLAAILPKANHAMQENRVDNIFQAMGKVVKGFQEVIDCTDCKMTCVDLISITAVFQQTDTYFECIAKARLDSAINMSFGGYEVPIKDPKLRAMLVTSLILQAVEVLDAISAKGDRMIRTLCSPTPMAHANIGYLNTVIGDFKGVLQGIAKSVDESVSLSAVSTTAQ